ncbi:hypothetical protein OnM2_045040 [Erysiphe neolycopersici]|uniref:Uncharacterized protein n=1 Tax=Erysiphe neolycopersici TaxID=212602 RepID=A0A420HUJ2_9PEZI|nr:hypothetical protein OnM2_045040 [Erysiphe neolycopersici]
MRLLIIHWFLLIVNVTSFQASFDTESFHKPYFRELDVSLNPNSTIQEDNIEKRDGNCPVNHNSCSTFAADYGGACCAIGSRCTTDAAHQIACCTTGAKCTGTLYRPSLTTADDTFPSPTMTLTTSNDEYSGPTMTGSVVNNIYFPFPYSPTTYPDKGECLSALDACHKNYDACIANLEGSNYGVTIIAPAGGITVAPTAHNLGPSSATRICSSLSLRACYDIHTSDCNQFGGTFATPTAANAIARPTMGCLVPAAGILAAMGWEIARQVV